MSYESKLPALKLTRVAFGCVALVGVGSMWDVLVPLFSNGGVWPVEDMLRDPRASEFPIEQLFRIAKSDTALDIVWACTMVSVFLFTIGVKTRWMAFLSYALIGALSNRNFLAVRASFEILRVMFFWFTFVPWPSVHPTSSLFDSLSLQLCRFQVAWVYLSAAFWKLTGDSWRNGQAMFYVLKSTSPFVRDSGRELAEIAGLPIALTFLVVFLEILIPLLVLSPVMSRQMIRIGLVLGLILHAGMLYAMNLPLFSLEMLATYPLFVIPRGRPTSAMVFPASSSPIRLTLSVSLCIVMCLCFAVGMPGLESSKLVNPFRHVVRCLSVFQKWNMYAPNPPFANLTLIGAGQLDDGSEVDALQGRGINISEAIAKSHFWRSYVGSLLQLPDDDTTWLLEFGRYVCRTWNKRETLKEIKYEKRLRGFTLWRYSTPIAFESSSADPPVAKERIWIHQCF